MNPILTIVPMAISAKSGLAESICLTKQADLETVALIAYGLVRVHGLRAEVVLPELISAFKFVCHAWEVRFVCIVTGNQCLRMETAIEVMDVLCHL